MINESQAKEIEKMGNNYEQIGRYLMDNGKLPNNVQSYQGQDEQVQNMMKQEQ
jgi:membrane-bound lytic murein transglycosylase